jgi:hypothetical protein
LIGILRRWSIVVLRRWSICILRRWSVCSSSRRRVYKARIGEVGEELKRQVSDEMCHFRQQRSRTHVLDFPCLIETTIGLLKADGSAIQ